MIQIILYVALAGVAVFFYALTRPEQKTNNTDVIFQRKMESLLKKMEQEQIKIVESIHNKVSALQIRIDKLEEKMQQQVPESSFPYSGSAQTSDHFADVYSFSPKHMQVVHLLKQGKNERDIARQTGVGIGEIELLQRLLQQGQGEVR